MSHVHTTQSRFVCLLYIIIEYAGKTFLFECGLSMCLIIYFSHSTLTLIVCQLLKIRHLSFYNVRPKIMVNLSGCILVIRPQKGNYTLYNGESVVQWIYYENLRLVFKQIHNNNRMYRWLLLS